MANWLDKDGVLYLWTKIKALVNASKVTVNNTLIGTSTSEALSAAQGKALNDKISQLDKDGDGIVDNAEKVNGFTVEKSVPANAVFTDTVYTHPTHTAKTSGFYKVTVDSEGHVSAVTAVAKADITGLGIPAQDTTYSEATTSANGLMSANDKSKLNALPTNDNLEAIYAKKSDISGMYVFKGSVTNESSLPTSGVEVGWVYNIVNSSSYGGAGMNVVWTGEAWDALGEVFTIERITNTELDEICV